MGREGEEEACPLSGAGGRLVANVVRLNSGGGSTIEKIGLTVEQAKELAARLTEAGQPPGCCWCVGSDDESEETEG